MQPDLSIVIVSWNVRDLLRECLASIRAGGELSVEVIVVDSASSDGTPDMLHKAFPQVTLVEPGTNVGFTRGNNIGIEASRGRHVLLLNPDTRVLGSGPEKMVAYMDGHPKVGALGPQLLNEDGSVQSSRRRFPTLRTAFFESTWLQPHAPQKVLDHYYMLDHEDDETVAVDWVQGAAVLVRREAIEQVGMMDEGFFMYSEELDWQRRIKAAGWEVIYYPEAQIVHHGGKSSEQVVAQRDIYFHSSKIRYFRKHHGAGVAFVLRLFLLGNYIWQLGLEAGKWLLGHKRAMRGARVRAYWQVLRSGLKG
jgi:N-acetylglucosaminyl-diphospho-decaprenol L-rhamnosyltransferase